MADKIVVMHDGIVEQMGEPLELYDRPKNLFVAGFIGSPAMIMIKGKMAVNGVPRFRGAGIDIPVPQAPAGVDGKAVVFGIRPEHLLLVGPGEPGFEAEVIVVEPTGSEIQVAAKLGGAEIIAVFRERHLFRPGEKIRLAPRPDVVHLFEEATGKRL